MRAVLGSLSLLALGLMAAAAVAVVLTGGDGRLAGLEARTGSFELDHASLVVGIGLGVLLTLIARISWLEIPRRAIAWLLDHVPWSEAEHTIRAEPADARTAGLMRIARGTACLVIERRTWQSRKAITLARLIHPGARHCLRGRFRLGASSRLRAER